MADPRLNDLLKWSITNSENSNPPTGVTLPHTNGANGIAPPTSSQQAQISDTPATDAQLPPAAPAATSSLQGLDPAILQALMGGPSDADLMKAAMSVLLSSEDPLEQKLIAFDNFEQLIESIDNANNLSNLGLWSPLLGLLESPESELRRYAAWCVGTAVQNNISSQERLLVMGGIPKLLDLVLVKREGGVDEVKEVKRKAVYALSSAVRNCQPAMDVLAEELVKHGRRKSSEGKVDADEMSAADAVINDLRELVAQSSA